jgi:hypothetical protein
MTNLPNMSNPSTLPPQFQHEEVAKEAFRIWCEEGCPEGRADENWRQAQFHLASKQSENPQRSDRSSSDRSSSPARRGSQGR